MRKWGHLIIKKKKQRVRKEPFLLSESEDKDGFEEKKCYEI